MPEYTVELMQDLLNKVKLPMNGTTIGLLGVSYKDNVADLRESPALRIIKFLEKHGVDVIIFDPYIPQHSTEKTLEDLLDKSTGVIVATGHKEFRALSADILKKHGVQVIVDGLNCLDKAEIENSGILYKGIGR